MLEWKVWHPDLFDTAHRQGAYLHDIVQSLATWKLTIVQIDGQPISSAQKRAIDPQAGNSFESIFDLVAE